MNAELPLRKSKAGSSEGPKKQKKRKPRLEQRVCSILNSLGIEHRKAIAQRLYP